MERRRTSWLENGDTWKKAFQIIRPESFFVRIIFGEGRLLLSLVLLILPATTVSVPTCLGEFYGPLLRATWPVLGSDHLNLDQSGTSIQILLEPNFFFCLWNYHSNTDINLNTYTIPVVCITYFLKNDLWGLFFFMAFDSKTYIHRHYIDTTLTCQTIMQDHIIVKVADYSEIHG